MNHYSTALRTLLFASALSFAVVPALAAGTGGDSGGTSPGTGNTNTPSPKKLKCKSGYVVKSVTVDGVTKRKCVRATAGVLPDKELFEQGNALAQEGEYDWALQVLAQVRDQNQPDVQNMQGYSHRKSGRLEVAIGYYRKALALNPDFVRAREYLGEGYASAGRLDLARMELAEIEKRCGVTCTEYKDLSEAIARASN